ncbi:M2 family metallopeptidase [bacterium]|nr:M2 family metallopeptidase [bacterium]
MNPTAETELCRRLENDIEPMETELRRAQWDAECTGEAEAFARVETCQKQVMRRLANRSDYDLLQNLRRQKSAERGASLSRQLDRWSSAMARQQINEEKIDRLAAEEASLVQQYNGFRADLAGERVGDNRIDRILAESRDSLEVETAWRASKRIADFRGDEGKAAPVYERLTSLIGLRNEAAREIGHPDAYQSSLTLSELDPGWLFETLAELDRVTRPVFQTWKKNLDAKLAERFSIDSSALRPWHYGDRFFQSVPKVEDSLDLDPLFANKDVVELTVRSFDELGFDIRPIIARSDLYPGDPSTSKKCQHAFCTTIVAPSDVRVLCNVVPGARWMSTMLHEFGHAVYGESLDPSAPYILRDDAHLLANEAIALLMERHLLDIDWLTKIAGVDRSAAEQIASRGRRQIAEKHLVFTRWVLVMCHFERELYRNPSRTDLGRLWWDIVEEYQEVRRPEPDRMDHDWSAKIHFVGFPAYYQNYLLGEVFGTQLEQAVRQQCGGMFMNPSAGAFLKERMFHSGARYPWRELLEKLTGDSFAVEPFLEVTRWANS